MIEAPAATEHRFEVRLAGETPEVEGPLQRRRRREVELSRPRAEVAAVHDPQGAVSEVSRRRRGRCRVDRFVRLPRRQAHGLPGTPVRRGRMASPARPGRRQPWTIVERYRAAAQPRRPGVALAGDRREAADRMRIELDNGRAVELAGRAKITVAGRTVEQDVKIPAVGPRRPDRGAGRGVGPASPGSVPVTIELAGRTETKAAVCWETRQRRPSRPPRGCGRSTCAPAQRRNGPALQPRHPMAHRLHRGAARRGPPAPLPLKDERGWVLDELGDEHLRIMAPCRSSSSPTAT